MNNSLGNWLFYLYTFAGIVVIHNGVPVESLSHLLRHRRQTEGKCQRPEIPAHGNYIDLSNSSLKQQALPLNTVLQFNCDTGFKLSGKSNLIRCLSDGRWSPEPPTCSNISVCGTKREAVRSLIMNGKEVKAGHFPWVAAIYHKTEDGIKYACGGTMLTQKIIVTFVHSVTDELSQTMESKLKVGVGKYYNKFNDERDTMAQYSDVLKVLIHPWYQGVQSKNPADMAFLVTKDTLLLSPVVQPACISANFLSPRTEGVVAGWGYAAANSPSSSDELSEIRVDEVICGPFGGYDKFCAEYLNSDISTCTTASGNGIVFKNPEDGRFYFQGILSYGKKTPGEKCTSQNVWSYTDVYLHYNWLQETIAPYH